MQDTITLTEQQFDTFLSEMGARMEPVLAQKAATLVGEFSGTRAPKAVTGVAGSTLDARGFFKAVLTGDFLKAKALSEGTDSAGGYLVPLGFREEVIARLPETSELAPHVTVVPVASDTGAVPSLATDIAIQWRAGGSGGHENAAFYDTNPVFGTVGWNLKRADAITKLSRELVSDSRPAVVDFIMRLFLEAIARERDKMIATGNGTSQPTGLAHTAGIPAFTMSGLPDYAELVGIEQTLPRKYRTRARWIMNGTNLRRIYSLTDTQGRPIFNRDVVGGVPESRILGYPVAQQDSLGDSEIYFGDLTHYLWFDRGEMGVESTTTGGDAFANHEVWCKVFERADGKLALPEAFVKGTGISAS